MRSFPATVFQMKLRILAVFALGIVLAGCGDRSPAPETAAATAPADQAASPIPQRQTGLPVADGLPVDFDFTVSSRRDIENEDGSTNHVLRVVYNDVEADKVAGSIERAFREKQHRVEKVSEDGTKLNYLARGGESRIRYVIVPAGPDLSVDLQGANARGMVTFYWKD